MGDYSLFSRANLAEATSQWECGFDKPTWISAGSWPPTPAPCDEKTLEKDTVTLSGGCRSPERLCAPLGGPRPGLVPSLGALLGQQRLPSATSLLPKKVLSQWMAFDWVQNDLYRAVSIRPQSGGRPTGLAFGYEEELHCVQYPVAFFQQRCFQCKMQSAEEKTS